MKNLLSIAICLVGILSPITAMETSKELIRPAQTAPKAMNLFMRSAQWTGEKPSAVEDVKKAIALGLNIEEALSMVSLAYPAYQATVELLVPHLSLDQLKKYHTDLKSWVQEYINLAKEHVYDHTLAQSFLLESQDHQKLVDFVEGELRRRSQQ